MYVQACLEKFCRDHHPNPEMHLALFSKDELGLNLPSDLMKFFSLLYFLLKNLDVLRLPRGDPLN